MSHDFSKNAVYVRGDQMQSFTANEANWNNMNLTDVWLSFAAFFSGRDALRTSLLDMCEENDFVVSLWTQALFIRGSWYNPTLSSGQERLSSYYNDVENWIAEDGIQGINIDYVRFPGTAHHHTGAVDAITSICEEVKSIVEDEDINYVVSAAVMPETTVNAYYYGQDTGAMSQHLDVIAPMVYIGNYSQTNTWITNTSNWFDDQADCDVYPTLQTYWSDSNVTVRPVNTLTANAEAVRSASTEGISFFRHGLICSGCYSPIGDMVDPVYGVGEEPPEYVPPEETETRLFRTKSGCQYRIVP